MSGEAGRGGGSNAVWLFGTFPKIHPFWKGKASLIRDRGKWADTPVAFKQLLSQHFVLIFKGKPWKWKSSSLSCSPFVWASSQSSQVDFPWHASARGMCQINNKHSLFIVRSLNVFILKNPTLKLFSKCICLSFCWSGHVSSPLWSNVSKVKSLKDHSLKLFSKCYCLCLCLCICFKITFWHVWWLAGSDYRKISKSWINPICRCSHFCKKTISYSHQWY